MRFKAIRMRGRWCLPRQIGWFEVDERTIERYLAQHGEELGKNGYQVLRGKSLKNFRLADVSGMNVGDKAASLGIFTFRALLNN